MMDETTTKELVTIFEEAYEQNERAKLFNKTAKTMIKEWSESHEKDPKVITEVYAQYKAYRMGKLKWGEEGEDDEYAQILVNIMDEVTK